MQLKSINLFLVAVALVYSTACSKKASSDDPGRSVDVTDTTGGTTSGSTTDGTTTVDDVDRGGDTSGTTTTGGSSSSTGDVIDTTAAASNNVLFTSYRGVIPSTKVCKNILESRSAATLKKFFNWDIQNLEGPVTVCAEQETAAPVCPNGENYCSAYPSRHVRIRIEYEDDFRFWYYDSEKDTNYAKLLSYTGGAGSSAVEVILMDGAGFLSLNGIKTSSGAYDVAFAFADRPTYSAARNYDIANGFASDSLSRRSATLWDMKQCAQSPAGDGTLNYGDGASNNCAERFVLAYQFFSTLNADYPQTAITNNSLWIQNQVTIARQYVNNSFSSFSSYTGYQGGTFGRLLLNGM